MTGATAWSILNSAPDYGAGDGVDLEQALVDFGCSGSTARCISRGGRRLSALTASAFCIRDRKQARRCSSGSIANAGLRASARRRAILLMALSLLESGGMPTCPWLRRERGARRRENLAIVRGGAGAESQSDRASALQIVLAPRKGQRP